MREANAFNDEFPTWLPLADLLRTEYRKDVFELSRSFESDKDVTEMIKEEMKIKNLNKGDTPN